MRRLWLAVLAVVVCAGAAWGYAPNDPAVPQQWELAKTGVLLAWNYTMGKPGIKVAVIDGGVVSSNRDLTAKLLAGRNIVTGTGITNQVCDEHGTHMASIAAAIADNGFAMAGVGAGCSILPVQVSMVKTVTPGGPPLGYATWGNIAAGLRWAADQGARVAIVPYEVTGVAEVESAAAYATGKGCFVVASIGNAWGRYTAASSPYIFTVSALDENGVPAFGYGPSVKIAAPGVKLTVCSWYDSWYSRSASGSSEAAAFVGGAAALLLSQDPNLTPAQLETILESTADDLGTPGRDEKFGYGRVNVLAAMQVAAGGAPPHVHTWDLLGQTYNGAYTVYRCSCGALRVTQP